MKIVYKYGIDYDDVRVFNLDNVLYMMKEFCDILFCLFFFCSYIICYSYIVNFVVLDFKKGFKEVIEFFFFVLSGRKSRFLNFL